MKLFQRNPRFSLSCDPWDVFPWVVISFSKLKRLKIKLSGKRSSFTELEGGYIEEKHSEEICIPVKKFLRVSELR